MDFHDKITLNPGTWQSNDDNPSERCFALNISPLSRNGKTLPAGSIERSGHGS